MRDADSDEEKHFSAVHGKLLRFSLCYSFSSFKSNPLLGSGMYGNDGQLTITRSAKKEDSAQNN